MATPEAVTLRPALDPVPRSLSARGDLPSLALGSGSYFAGLGTAAGTSLVYSDVSAFVWWDSIRLDDPVRLLLTEDLSGVFVDAGIEAAFFPAVDLPIGSVYRIGDALRPAEDLYKFRISERSESGGLISYRGETILRDLTRLRPEETFVLIPGQPGPPDGTVVGDPLYPDEALRRYLDFLGIDYDPEIPPFFFRTSDGMVAPSLDAFVIEPNEEDPESVYEWVEQIFSPFSGYVFRADEANRLVVTAPDWIDRIGVVLTASRDRLHLFGLGGTATPSASAPWISTDRAPTVTLYLELPSSATVHTVGPLVLDTPISVQWDVPALLGGIREYHATVTWNSADNSIDLDTYAVNTTGGFRIRASFVPDAVDGTESLILTQADLGIPEILTISADTVVNQAEVSVRGVEFLPNQVVMQPSAAILRSPPATIQNLTRNTIGPAEGPTPASVTGGYGLLDEVEGTSHVFDWPVGAGVVAQPGSMVQVTLRVREFVTVWGGFGIGSNTPDQTVEDLDHTEVYFLSPDGSEYKAADLVYDFGTGITGSSASGAIYLRWIAGSPPRIQVRIQHDPAGSMFSFDPSYFFGQEIYMLWGALVELDGLGTTFTRGEEYTTRFGYNTEDLAEIAGLGSSQTLYGIRERRVSAGIYSIDPATALAMARSIVENEYRPTTARSLEIVPSLDPQTGGGYRLRPWHMGRTVQLPDGAIGTVRSWRYEENHIGRSTTKLDVEVAVPAGSAVARVGTGSTFYAKAAYKATLYGG